MPVICSPSTPPRIADGPVNGSGLSLIESFRLASGIGVMADIGGDVDKAMRFPTKKMAMQADRSHVHAPHTVVKLTEVAALQAAAETHRAETDALRKSVAPSDDGVWAIEDGNGKRDAQCWTTKKAATLIAESFRAPRTVVKVDDGRAVGPS